MRRLLIALGLSASLIGCATSGTQDPVVASATDAALADGPVAGSAWIGAAAESDAFVAGTQDTFVAVWVDVPTTAVASRASAAVGLVIDTSGSMEGDKIQDARLAAKKLVESLADGDIVSLHTFSDVAVQRVAPTRLDARTRQQINSIISEVKAEGATNIFDGVREAGLAVMAAPDTHPVRRVVLISDGNATAGNTSVEMIGNLGEKAGDRSVQVTAIGVGLDYNETILNQLATRSSGRLYHLTDSKALPEIIQSEVALLQSTRAANAKVAIVAAPGVQILGADGARGNFVDGNLQVPLGALFAGQHREFIVRVRITAPELVEGQSAKHPLASVRLVYADPNEGNLERIQETVARFDVVSSPSVAKERANAKALGVFAMIDASKRTETASIAINNDRFDDADAELAVTESNLRKAAEKATTSADKNRLEASANRVNATRSGAGAARSAPAPAKAAAKRKVSLEANDAALDMSGY